MKREALAIRVELPTSGRSAWPITDVEVRDARGEAIVVRRSGVEWHKLLIPASALRSTYFVQAIDLPGGTPRLPAENERTLTDRATGSSVSVSRW